MFYFKVEELNKSYLIKKDSLKEIKEEYNKILNSYSWLSISPIIKNK